MNAAATSKAPSLPLRLGRYLLLRELAAGGMGRVYAARVGGARGFEKLVAVKLIHDHFAREEKFRSMFFEEARLASRIEHRNVCSVLDFGEEEGVVYLVMEFLSGRPLSSIRKRLGERPEVATDPEFPAMAAHLVAEALEGLHAIHSATDEDGNPLNAVHRDVSPENVFVTFDGAVKVMDLGVAHASGRLHKTRPGEFKGKMAYVAPEQFDTGPADPRSDLWAAGAVLWELLVGRYLFWKGNERETLKAILTADVPPPSSQRAGLPPQLDDIVMRALRADPAQRYGSAREMARELHRFVAQKVGHLGTSEVGEWLDRLYPGERRRHAELLSEARSLGSQELEQAPRVQRTMVLRSESVVPPPPASHVGPVSAQGPGSVSAPLPLGQASSGWEDEPTEVHGELTSDPDGGPTIKAPPPSGALEAPVDSHVAQIASELRGPDLGPARRRGLLYLGIAVGVALLSLLLVKGLPGSEEGSATTEVAPEVSPVQAASERPGSTEEPAPSAKEAPAVPAPPAADTPNGSPGAAPSAVEVLPPADVAEPPEGDGVDEVPDETSDRAEAVGTSRRRSGRASSKRSEASRRAAGPPGYLSVSLRGGWADIYVDGEPKGRTPRRLKLSAGRHRVELRPFGRTPALRRTVRVRPGQTDRLVLDAPGR